jgi:predicted cupin superfamily sugar epimerase
MALTAQDVIRQLGLVSHPEGGFYRETFRAAELPVALPERGARSASTAIYFLLRRGDFSAFHRVSSDEAWHHYLGAALELHLLGGSGHERLVLGPRLELGERPQAVVPRGVLQAARLVTSPSSSPSEYDFALVGCTVAPGFDFQDFEMPSRSALLAELPAHREIIEELTRT